MTAATFNVFLGRLPLPWLDVVALLWFSIWWIVYVWYADYRRMTAAGIAPADRSFRARMDRAHGRARQPHARRQRDAQPYAQLAVLRLDTMLILGALVALMGYAEKAAGVLAELPFPSRFGARLGIEDPAARADLRLRVFQVFVVDPPVRLLLDSGRCDPQTAGGRRKIRGAHRPHHADRRFRKRQLQQRIARILFRRRRVVLVPASDADDRDDDRRRLCAARARVSLAHGAGDARHV